MALYMTQFSYTAEAWKKMVKNPVDRTDVLRGQIEKLGGRLIGLYYAFGDFDGVAIYDYPDDKSCVAGVLAVVCAGHVKATKTTVLMSADDTVEAMKKAGGLVYPAPE